MSEKPTVSRKESSKGTDTSNRKSASHSKSKIPPATPSFDRTCAFSIKGTSMEGTKIAAGIISGDEMNISQSCSILNAGIETTQNLALSGITIAKDTKLNNSAGGMIISKNVEMHESNSLLVLAGNVQGKVTTLLDWRSALAIGLAAGGLLGLISLLKGK